MPELPEVETVRLSLASGLIGARIDTVTFHGFTGSIAGATPEEFTAGVTGRRIVDLGRRAKYLLLWLDDGCVVTVHLRMTGELRLVRPDALRQPHHHITFGLDSGFELRFIDTRKFGRLRRLTPAMFAGLDAALGPEPLDERLTADRLAGMLAARRRAVKPLLLEQSFIAGVGNIYADEALFQAGIHPLRAACSITGAEAAALLAALRETLRAAIDRGGTTIRDYRDGLGRGGGNQPYLRVYSLPAGAPCPRCGAPIERIVVGQRGTKLCPRCQPAQPSPTARPRPPTPAPAGRSGRGSGSRR